MVTYIWANFKFDGTIKKLSNFGTVSKYYTEIFLNLEKVDEKLISL